MDYAGRVMQFRETLRNVLPKLRSNYHVLLNLSMITLIILVVYREDLTIVANEALQSEAVSHVILVPLVISYLLYRKREIIKASAALERTRETKKVVSLKDLFGICTCILALLLYWYGSYTFYALEYHLISLPIFVMGTTLILFNLKMLIALIFPILFLLFLIPPPSELVYTAGAFLAYFNTQAAYALLKVFNLPVSLSFSYWSPIIVVDSSSGPISLAIDVACSGVYSLIAFTMFGTFLAYFVRGSMWKKMTVFVLGFLILQVLNVIRISSIVLIGHFLGRETAMDIFHIFSGWILIFSGMLLLLFIGKKLLHIQIFRTSRIDYCSKCKIDLANHQSFCSNCGRFLKRTLDRTSTTFLAKSVALLFGALLLTVIIQAPVFALAQGSVVTNANWQTSTNILPETSGYQLRFLNRDTDYEEIAGQDAALLYAYVPENPSNSAIFVNVGVANSISNLHSWEVCFVSWRIAQGQPVLVRILDSRDTQICQNPPIVARYFVFESPENYTQVTLYWYEKIPFNTGVTVEQRYARISLIIYAASPNNYQKLEETLLPFAQSIAAHWEPLKGQSLISLGVPMLQSMFVLAIFLMIFMGTTKYIIEKRRKNNNQKIFNNYASEREKIVLQAIRNATEENTLQTLVSALKKNAGKAMRPSELAKILKRLEDYGMVKKDVKDAEDTSILIWKI